MIGVWLMADEIKLKEKLLNWLKMEKQSNSNDLLQKTFNNLMFKKKWNKSF